MHRPPTPPHKTQSNKHLFNVKLHLIYYSSRTQFWTEGLAFRIRKKKHWTDYSWALLIRLKLVFGGCACLIKMLNSSVCERFNSIGKGFIWTDINWPEQSRPTTKNSNNIQQRLLPSVLVDFIGLYSLVVCGWGVWHPCGRDKLIFTQWNFIWTNKIEL